MCVFHMIYSTCVCLMWFTAHMCVFYMIYSKTGNFFATRENRTLIVRSVFGLLWTGPSDFRKMCTMHVRTAVQHCAANPSRLHLRHSFTKQPCTDGYPLRDIRARKRRPGTVRPSSNSDRTHTLQINKAVWSPGFGHNCQCTIILAPQQTAYRSVQTLRVFCDIKRRRFARVSRRFERT
jgi:hypothetical protein